MARFVSSWRGWVRWGVWGAFALIVVVWIGSGWIWVGFSSYYGRLKIGAGVLSGAYVVGHSPEVSWMIDVRPSPIRWRFDWWHIKPGWAVLVPLWCPALALGLLAGGVEWRHRRRGRGLGLCRCGYSLTGLPAGAACPECGAEPKP
jgi:hypothetical protein